MLKKVLSVITIFFLLITSGVIIPLYNSGCYIYADEDGLSDEQMTNLATSTYFNNRNGWFKSSSSPAAVAMLNKYVNQFFTSSSNTTGINSYSDFAQHIHVGKDSNDHWGVSLDNDGVVFLDHLCKWCLGKDDFPNLYSGGSWGTGSTTDNIYNGASLSGSLFYIVTDVNVTPGSRDLSPSQIQEGTSVDGCTWQFLRDKFLQSYPN